MIRISKILAELAQEGLFTNRMEMPVPFWTNDKNLYAYEVFKYQYLNNIRKDMSFAHIDQLPDYHRSALLCMLGKYESEVKIMDVNTDELSVLAKDIVERIKGKIIAKDQLSDHEKIVYFPEDYISSIQGRRATIVIKEYKGLLKQARELVDFFESEEFTDKIDALDKIITKLEIK